MTIKIKKSDLPKVRRIALAAQGLLRDAPFGRGVSGARKAIAHLGYVQIDTISVVERAHNHVFRSRVPNFHPKNLDKMLKERSIFEYWSHAAAFLPMQDYRFSLCHRDELLKRRQKWMKPETDKVVREVLARIKADGPLRSRDLEDTRTTRSGWWDWKPAKRALEQLFFQGVLMVSERDGFQKSYDLSERVLPSHVDTTRPSFEAYAEHLLEQQLTCHGVVTRKGVTYMRTNKLLKDAVKALVDSRLSEKRLVELELTDGQKYLCRPEVFDRAAPRSAATAKILSPFDNIVIQRERLTSLFDFDYLIECYVPEPKRKYGYFTLPILYNTHFVGRMDCKAHRAQKVFEIKALHLEPDIKTDTEFSQALADAFIPFMDFQGCDTMALTQCHSKVLAANIKSHMQERRVPWTTTTPNN